MIFTVERLSNPEIEPMTLAEARLALSEFAGVTDRDAEITALITAAREWVEGFTGRTLIDTAWRLSLESETGDPPSSVNGILLRRSPVLEVTRVDTGDADEDEIDVANYVVRDARTKFPRLVAIGGTSLAPTAGGVLRITFRAGYADLSDSSGSAADVPERFRTAMKWFMLANYDPDEQSEARLERAEQIIRPECADYGFA
ncbi:MAG TPA: hypothetical protein VJ501_07170 [Burkholderiaceae bacterium]|nr:hypothetical protein [Burkholderiaceae bacterium]